MRLKLCVLALLAVMMTRPALSQPVIWDHHADIGVDYTLLSGWNLHIHDEDDMVEYDPADAILGVGVEALQPRPVGAQFDFIGVGAGDPVWILPQVQNPSLNFLGLAAEELDPDDLFEDWDPDGSGGVASARWFRFDLVSVVGPGDFSVWLNGGPSVAFATSDGVTSADRAFVLAGGHTDYNWAFTQPGTYEVSFTATGTLAGGTLSTSAPATYTFLVAAAPEPASLALCLVTLPLATCLRRRNKGKA
jgi:surface-anchored protein